MGKPKPNSFRGQVEAVVLRLGECTADQVLAEVASTIPASRAMNAYRWESKRDCRKTESRLHLRRDPLLRGKRTLVRDALKDLVQLKRIRRISPGVFAPLLPKLFEAC